MSEVIDLKPGVGFFPVAPKMPAKRRAKQSNQRVTQSRGRRPPLAVDVNLDALLETFMPKDLAVRQLIYDGVALLFSSQRRRVIVSEPRAGGNE